jgi:hypothetical protein
LKFAQANFPMKSRIPGCKGYTATHELINTDTNTGTL